MKVWNSSQTVLFLRSTITTGNERISFCQYWPLVLEDRNDFLPSRTTISPSHVASKSMQMKYRKGLVVGVEEKIAFSFGLEARGCLEVSGWLFFSVIFVEFGDFSGLLVSEFIERFSIFSVSVIS